MGIYAYTALDRQGRSTSGTIPAESRHAAMDVVLSRGLSPVSIEESRGSGEIGIGSWLPRRSSAAGKVPARAVEAFTRELANLLAAGLSLSRALALLKREASHPAASATWTKVHDDVVGGEALADALAQHPRAFSNVYVAMVRAGEAGGFLHVVLSQIAEFRQREKDLVGKVKAAMIYPVALAIVATGVLAFLLTFFIPRFAVIFDQFGSKLPWLTRMVVAVSGWLLSYGPLILLALIVGAIALRRWVATEAGRRAIERMILRTPGIGILTARFALVRFARMLGTLVGAGVPLVAALRVAREAIGNQTLSDTVGRAIEDVQRGEPLSRALSGDRLLFPAAVIEMISVAEETGRLDQELVRLAASYEGDLDRQLRLTVALAEPALLFVMAALIGTVVVSMLLPVFTLQDMIN